MRNPISCRTDSGLRCHFPDSYSTVQENFSHVRPSRLSIVPTFHIFQKDHPHRQSNPHEDASSRLVGANRKPNVFIPETSRSSKYLFKKSCRLLSLKTERLLRQRISGLPRRGHAVPRRCDTNAARYSPRRSSGADKRSKAQEE